MTLRERFDLPARDGDSLVYGTPLETADGATVITVARPGGWLRPGPRPLGIFVVHGEKVSWTPAFDTERIAFLGVLTGLLAAVIPTLALLRRPPWPDLRISR
ncbi:hypothetical protein NDR87_30465 [Nocardia sp. CDC159]|uniref:Uncharacterized protein n=1 Tax=Nocardia pulmonis TaxID=2951408 RepID=A0A9X2J0H3_9NOCA|nr:MULTISPECIES: hypothetical protein [Nocardia]MCM6777819.1 hypothetical protein [Nocardia pulmonis]MCM6790703.1 hypothetical protein [Nocardia sp. CDC159]